jgi:CRISPR-associated protein Csx10
MGDRHHNSTQRTSSYRRHEAAGIELMHRISVTLNAPVTIPSGPPNGNITRSRDYVPGTVLRGALASVWIARHGPPGPSQPLRNEFIELFEGSVRWPDLRLEHVTPIPPSVVECKYKPTIECETFAYDMADVDNSVYPHDCPQCAGPTSHGKGTSRGTQLERHTRTALVSVGVGRTGTAAEGTLHTVEALPTGADLSGVIHTAGSQVADHFIESLNGEAIRLGRRKTVQGRATITISAAAATAPELTTDGTIIVRLLSDAIIIDDAGRSLSEFDLTEFRTVLGDDSIEIGTPTWVRTGRIGGWHSSAGLPKPTEVTVIAGSTIALTGASDVQQSDLIRLVERGIGLRRNEGFGALTVNPPAWRPSTAETEPDEQRQIDQRYDVLRRASPADQKWLARLLAERLAGFNDDQSGPTAAPRRRLDDMSPALRSAVRDLLASTDPATIRTIRDQLADPANTTNRAAQ